MVIFYYKILLNRIAPCSFSRVHICRQELWWVQLPQLAIRDLTRVVRAKPNKICLNAQKHYLICARLEYCEAIASSISVTGARCLLRRKNGLTP